MEAGVADAESVKIGGVEAESVEAESVEEARYSVVSNADKRIRMALLRRSISRVA